MATDLVPRQAKTAQQRSEQDHSRKIEQLQHQAKADADRLRMRSEAEVADCRATISRLEVDLLKVRRLIFPGVRRRADETPLFD